MSVPVALPPLQPLKTQPFTDCTLRGLFSAPWLEHPAENEIRTLEEIALSLGSSALSATDPSAILSLLLKVRVSCLRAARSRSQALALEHYAEARAQCLKVMNRLHNAVQGTPADLAAWARGVHMLIMAQETLPRDMGASRELAQAAAQELTEVHDPLCAGAAPDAIAARMLAESPTGFAGRLEQLPEESRALVDRTRTHLEARLELLNDRLAEVRAGYERTAAAAVGWGLLNLLLILSVPLNGFLFPQIPWSLPPAVGLFVLWWYTWFQPNRDGLLFFQWVGVTRRQALKRLEEAVTGLPDLMGDFQRIADEMMMQARVDQQAAEAFFLWAPPESLTTVAVAVSGLEEGMREFSGIWMADKRDSHPWPVPDLLPVRPSLLPLVTRFWHGSPHH